MIINTVVHESATKAPGLPAWPMNYSDQPPKVQGYLSDDQCIRTDPTTRGLLVRISKLGNTPEYHDTYPADDTTARGVVMYTETDCRAVIGVSGLVSKSMPVETGEGIYRNIPAGSFVYFIWEHNVLGNTALRIIDGNDNMTNVTLNGLLENITCFLSNRVSGND